MGFGQEKLHGKARQLTSGWIGKIIKAFLNVVGKVSQVWDEESVAVYYQSQHEEGLAKSQVE